MTRSRRHDKQIQSEAVDIDALVQQWAQDGESGRYTCPECPEHFESVGDKKRHIKAHHEN